MGLNDYKLKPDAMRPSLDALIDTLFLLPGGLVDGPIDWRHRTAAALAIGLLILLIGGPARLAFVMLCLALLFRRVRENARFTPTAARVGAIGIVFATIACAAVIERSQRQRAAKEDADAAVESARALEIDEARKRDQAERALLAEVVERVSRAMPRIAEAERLAMDRDFGRAIAELDAAEAEVHGFRTVRGGVPAEVSAVLTKIDSIAGPLREFAAAQVRIGECTTAAKGAAHVDDVTALAVYSTLAGCDADLGSLDEPTRNALTPRATAAARNLVSASLRMLRGRVARLDPVVAAGSVAGALRALADGASSAKVVSRERDDANGESVTRYDVGSLGQVEVRRDLANGAAWTMEVSGSGASALGRTVICGGQMQKIVSGPLSGEFVNPGGTMSIVLSRGEMQIQMRHEGGSGSLESYFQCPR